MLIGDTETYYFNNIERIRDTLTFNDIVRKVKSHFENESIKQFYLHYWNRIMLQSTIAKHPDKLKLEYLNILLEEL